MKCSRVSLPPYHTFEPICVQLTTSGGPIVLLNIYRPGSVRPSASFFDELSSVLEVLVTFSCSVLVAGDINIHVEDTADVDARRLHELLTSFDITQHVNSPTHRLGGTLDLVMTFTDYQLTEHCVDSPGIISDHYHLRSLACTLSPANCRRPGAVYSATGESVETSRPRHSTKCFGRKCAMSTCTS